jgi:hypothetical protein
MGRGTASCIGTAASVVMTDPLHPEEADGSVFAFSGASEVTQ